jgi:4-amino-4-deoxy-L-arabinose transferase-like glycosyltransferase
MSRYDILKDYRVWLMLLCGLFIGISWHAYLVVFHPEARPKILSEMLLPFGVKVVTDGGVSATHYSPFWFFLIHIWRITMPAALLFPLVVWQTVRQRCFAADSPWRLLLLSFFVPFVVFSIIPQKQEHYLLPILPPLAFLTAGCTVDAVSVFRGKSRLWYAVPAGILALTCVGFAVTTGFVLPLVGDLSVWIGVLAGALCLAAAIGVVWATARGRWGWVLVAGVFGVWIGWLAYFAVLRPVEDKFGSGAMFSDPRYDEAAWNAKFERYPYLKRALDVERGKSHHEHWIVRQEVLSRVPSREN